MFARKGSTALLPCCNVKSKPGGIQIKSNKNRLKHLKHFIVRFFWLNTGLALFSLGIVLTIRANIGFSPWDVFHAGVSETAGITLGTASILVGLVILIVVALMKEKLGLGTIFNMVIIGLLVDVMLPLIPMAEGFMIGIPMLVSGLFIISLGSYFYIGSGFGAGPRDSLMVVLMRITKKSAGFCRTTVESIAVAVGWLLGGMVGIGTVIAAIGIGFCIQITFKLLKFDATAVKHETLTDTLRLLLEGHSH